MASIRNSHQVSILHFPVRKKKKKKTASEQWILEVDMLEAESKRKDLSNFDKGSVIMAGLLCQGISKKAGLVGLG